jgi:hypothetical protein
MGLITVGDENSTLIEPCREDHGSGQQVVRGSGPTRHTGCHRRQLGLAARRVGVSAPGRPSGVRAAGT